MYRMSSPLSQIRHSATKPTGPAGLQDLVSIRSTYVFELGTPKKVAGFALADFSHPA
jgi:hypothetical protein